MTKKKQEPAKSRKSSAKNGDSAKIIELEAQIAELNESLLRERADAMNVRNRAEEEKAKLGGFYKALVIKELLPIIDNFDRALGAIDAEGKKSELEKGFESIYRQFETALSKLGVEKIKTVGEHFDPNLHEAVTMEEGEGKEEIVSEELQAGYKIQEEVLRHAMVRVKS